MDRFKKAEVIWGNESDKNTWMCFRKNFVVENIESENILKIEADTKYWLYINGEMIVREGGLNRESVPGSGYYDQADIGKYMNEGLNLICVLVWYWGVSGRNNVDSNQPGLSLECESLKLISDGSFLAKKHVSYIESGEPKPSYLYGGHDICFKADESFEDWFLSDFDDSEWKNAIVCENRFWGAPVKRPIPLHKYSNTLKYKNINTVNKTTNYDLENLSKELGYINSEIGYINSETGNNNTDLKIDNLKYEKYNMADKIYECILPYACQLNPCLEVIGVGDEKITIFTDRYNVNGGPGDENHSYRGHKIEYITKKGKQSFESFNWVFGEKIYYIIPGSVNVLNLGYRESGYDCEISGVFKCDNEKINKLVEKCSRTLYICMRDNYMDCPDRERGQWIGDISNQIPQTFYSLSRSSDFLSEKAIMDFLNFRKDKIIFGNVPGINYSELPSQSLNAISDAGLIMEYYRFSGKKEIIEKSYDAVRDYLLLWNIKNDGLIEGRSGDWAWFDHLKNPDEIILENAWYYLALKAAIKMAKICSRESDISEYENRAAGIEKGIEKYWTGNCYKSIDFPDDRANGMVLLSGICPENRVEKIIDFLKETFLATPYMEYYILEGMCRTGYCREALERMLKRYDGLIENDNSTLWEDFNILGTKNHAWSGGPLSILYKYVAGIYPIEPGMKSFSILPNQTEINDIEAGMEIADGLLKVSIKHDEKRFLIFVKSPATLKFRIGAPFLNATNIYLNGQKRDDFKTNKTHTYLDCEGEIIEFKCEFN